MTADSNITSEMGSFNAGRTSNDYFPEDGLLVSNNSTSVIDGTETKPSSYATNVYIIADVEWL
jgi:hypothetical protein